MKISEMLVRPVVVVREDTTLEAVARTMLEHRIGCVAVVNAHGSCAVT